MVVSDADAVVWRDGVATAADLSEYRELCYEQAEVYLNEAAQGRILF